jgi:hypothetical protein
MLDDDLRRRLERMAHVEDLRSDGCAPSAGSFDRTLLVVADAQSLVGCSAQDSAVSDVFEVVGAQAGRLWADGQPLDGGLRITASADSDRADPPRPYPWPSELALSEFYEDPTAAALGAIGRSKLVSAADAPPLRALRDQYLKDFAATLQGYDSEGIPVIDGTLSARLFMRDALPYEDPQGLWPLPGQ